MMSSEQKLQFLHFLFASAWSDGELVTEEREILQTILSGVDLPKDAVNHVWAWFEEAPEEPNWEDLKEDPVMREVFMRQAMVLAGSDMVFNIEEIQYLDRLREKTGMEEAEYHSLWSDVEKLLAQGMSNTE